MHPLKKKTVSEGLPVVMAPITLYSDDTSGNSSKKWNKFDLWCMILAGLPWQENAKLENIHFICTSNHVTAFEMAGPLVDDLHKLEKEGIVAYDVHLQMNVLAVAPIITVLGDNPRSLELTSHLGAAAKLFCRMCTVGFKCMHVYITIIAISSASLYVPRATRSFILAILGQREQESWQYNKYRPSTCNPMQQQGRGKANSMASREEKTHFSSFRWTSIGIVKFVVMRISSFS